MSVQPLGRDWAFIRAAVESLQDYLLSSELYWPLFVHPREKITGNLLQLTLGNLILTQARLGGYSWPASQSGELEKLNEAISKTRQQWKTAWRNKAAREFPARLNLWQVYLDDLCEEPKKHVANYPFQVRWRTALHFLEMELDGQAGVDDRPLKELDRRLNDISQAGNFVWEPEIASSFPKTTFWYLYLTIRGC